MYAVVETGGKQYRVVPGQTVEVELLPAEPGATITLDRVLLVAGDGRTLVGTPVVPGAHVVATVTREGRGKKVIVFRYKAKKRYRRKTGHRQSYTYLTITDIQAEGKSLVPDDERRRFEKLATRGAARYERRIAERLGAPIDDLAMAQALDDARAAARDEELIEEERPAPSVRARRGRVAAPAPAVAAVADVETAATADASEDEDIEDAEDIDEQEADEHEADEDDDEVEMDAAEDDKPRKR